MRYAQLFHMSTGYVAGSTPPVFREDNRYVTLNCDRSAVTWQVQA